MKQTIHFIVCGCLCVLLLCATVLGQRVSLASMNITCTEGANYSSVQGSVSGDGRFITFESRARDLVPQWNGYTQVYIFRNYDRALK